MSTKQRPTIAVVVGSNNSEYLREVTDGFQYCAREEDVNLIFVKEATVPKYCKTVLSDEFEDTNNFHFHKVHQYMNYLQPDVVILAYGSMTSFSYVRSQQEFWEQYAGIPCLLMEDVSVDAEIPYLISDNYGGMRQMMEHLVYDHHYRQICFLAGPEINFDSKERLRAYLDVMKEAGLRTTENMIAYGDYSDQVEEQVEQLLDAHPGIEALVCANDNMAKTAYHVCERRGLLIGSDIAITGYDNSEICRKLNPSLTTVSHSGLLYAYEALHAAIRLYYGEEVKSHKIETFICKRGSCGCNQLFALPETEEVDRRTLHNYLKERIQTITDEIFGQMPYKRLQLEYHYLLEELFDYIVFHVFDRDDKELSKETITRYLRKIYSYPFISEQVVGECIRNLLQDLIDHTENASEKDKILFILTASGSYLHSKEIMDMRSKSDNQLRQTWYLASFTRDLTTAGMTYEENMQCLLKRMRAMGFASTYILLFQENVECNKEQGMKLPERIYLAGYYTKEELIVMPYRGGQPISGAEGFSQVIPKEGPHVYTTYLLFAGDRHYGMLLCENEEHDYDYVLECSMQIAGMFHYMTLQEAQQKSQQELRMTLKRIEEQNRVLSFVSQQDELTKLWNRRGFMEEAIVAFRKHRCQMAAVVFADLDHLKEINDCFGHMAGDFAIQKGASYLTEGLPKDAIIARVGGDEYIALIFVEQSSEAVVGFSQKFIDDVRQRMDAFNRTSDKPYYVELSMGAHEFICNEDTNIEAIISTSDAIMYREKQKRRRSIKKEQ